MLPGLEGSCGGRSMREMTQSAGRLMRRSRGRRRSSGAPTVDVSPRILLWVITLFLFCLLNSSPSAAALFNRIRSSSPSNSSHFLGIELPNHLSFNSLTSSHKSGCHHLRPAVAAAGRSRYKEGHHEDREEEEEGAWIDGHDVSLAGGQRPAPAPALKLQLKHRSAAVTSSSKEEEDSTEKSRKQIVVESTHRDLSRIQTLHKRITEKKNQNTLSRLTSHQHHRHQKHGPTGSSSQGLGSDKMKMPTAAAPAELAGRLMATLESGVTLGSGEYFMDVFVGTPPRHFSLILDTGSDLNWIQCLPCHDCFEQRGPHYDPSQSSSYRNVTCGDPRCRLVSSPDPPQPCRSADEPCPYFYWYGDRSNTTGDLALETFTVNLTAPDGTGRTEFRGVEDVIFGCGHWNRGLFHGAGGLLGLGRGPLSFSSQLRSLYGHTFSYCLVDRNSDLSVSSKLIFGEDRSLMSHPNLNFTSFTAGKENPADTFYYVQIKGIMVGGELLTAIPPETWELSSEGAGGTIIDSGTTLSYFVDPAYRVIKEAFTRKVKHYPPVDDYFPILSPCYNVSGVEKVELPEFAILFGDGAVWNFPVENYFIRLEPEYVVCLAIRGTPPSSLSILGNYQQQNFHIMYDTKKSRLGFAPMRCAEV